MRQETVRQFRKDLRRLERLVEKYLKMDTCCHGVSVAQCHTLLAVEQLGQISLNGLADFIELDKSTLSRTVEGLVKSGLLVREVAADDRRMTRIALTDQGREVCDGINRANDERFGRILASLNRDQEEVVAIFSELVTAMNEIQSYEESCATKLTAEEQHE